MTSYDWLSTLDPALKALDERPQFAPFTTFPLESLQKSLAKLFDRPHLVLSSQPKGWLKGENLLEGLGEHLKILEVLFPPLPTPLLMVMDEEEIKRLLLALFDAPEQGAFFLEPSYVQGFYHFFLASLLTKINELDFGKDLKALLGGEKEASDVKWEAGFSFDLKLEIGGQVIHGRLLINEKFRREWKDHFYGAPLQLNEELKKKIFVELALVGGSVQLSSHEWKQIQSGDLIVLDRCDLFLATGKHRLVLTLNETPLFRGKVSEGGIKLSEQTFYEEERAPMEEKEEDLYGDMEEEEDFEKSTDFEEEEGEALPIDEPHPALAKEPLYENLKRGETLFEKIPLLLTIEVGRLKMNVEELMQLAPGNLIDFQVQPEKGVDLVVNGRKMGRGELVKMGDVIGVRVLELS